MNVTTKKAPVNLAIIKIISEFLLYNYFLLKVIEKYFLKFLKSGNAAGKKS